MKRTIQRKAGRKPLPSESRSIDWKAIPEQDWRTKSDIEIALKYGGSKFLAQKKRAELGYERVRDRHAGVQFGKAPQRRAGGDDLPINFEEYGVEE